MATYVDGGRRKATANTVTAMRRSAERRTCTHCLRKSALTRYHGDYFSVDYCRWSREGKCDYDVDKALARALERQMAQRNPWEQTTQRIRREIASR